MTTTRPPSDLPTRTPSLADVARGLVARPDLWRHHVLHHPDHRVHLRLAATEGWEAWLLTWPSGHGVEVHDHGGSAGALAVVEGELVEMVARRASGALAGGLARRTLSAGTVRRVPPDRVHDVLNLSAAPATSIHVYGPALATMTFYDDALRPTRTERVFPEPPLVGAAEVRAALGAGR